MWGDSVNTLWLRGGDTTEVKEGQAEREEVKGKKQYDIWIIISKLNDININDCIVISLDIFIILFTYIHNVKISLIIFIIRVTI